MIIRILKTVTLAGVGTFSPGMVVNIPSPKASAWVESGKAMAYDGQPWKAAPEPKDIPEGMFFCEVHQRLHKLNSKLGKKCQKLINVEEGKESED